MKCYCSVHSEMFKHQDFDATTWWVCPNCGRRQARGFYESIKEKLSSIKTDHVIAIFLASAILIPLGFTRVKWLNGYEEAQKIADKDLNQSVLKPQPRKPVSHKPPTEGLTTLIPRLHVLANFKKHHSDGMSEIMGTLQEEAIAQGVRFEVLVESHNKIRPFWIVKPAGSVIETIQEEFCGWNKEDIPELDEHEKPFYAIRTTTEVDWENVR